MTEVNAEIITPFGPSIFKVKIPNQIVDDLNQYVDNTVADETKANKLNKFARILSLPSVVQPSTYASKTSFTFTRR